MINYKKNLGGAKSWDHKIYTEPLIIHFQYPNDHSPVVTVPVKLV